MHILHVHNFYKMPGGEDQSFASTGAMLEDRGHRVTRFTLHNDVIEAMGRVASARATLWNASTARQLRDLIRSTRPDIAHFENTFPLVSPAAYYACRGEGVPVVQTLRNFRLVCPSAILYRSGNVCEDCVGKRVPWPGVLHGCYRDSRLTSAAVAAMLAAHRVMGTWQKRVDAYIALTAFARTKLIEGGLVPAKIHVNPNFLNADPGLGDGKGGYALFAGRLTPEKGIRTILAAWEELAPDLPLKILGDGPDSAIVAEAARRHEQIEWLGWRHPEMVLELIGRAKIVVMPSLWYEGFGRALMEAFAKGTPVVGSNLGSVQEIVDHGRTGLLFAPNDSQDLVRQIRWLLASPEAYVRMRRAARLEFETRFTAATNHERLMRIYDAAREQRERTAGSWSRA